MRVKAEKIFICSAAAIFLLISAGNGVAFGQDLSAWGSYGPCGPGAISRTKASHVLEVGKSLANVPTDGIDIIECRGWTGMGPTNIVDCGGRPYTYCLLNDNDGAGNYIMLGVRESNQKQVNPDNGNSYQRFDAPLSWNGAKSACEELGAHLVTIASQAEHDWVSSHFGTDSAELWTGGTDQNQEGVWEWITGEFWSYTNWGANEPNNSGNEDYINLVMRDQRVWNDDSGYKAFSYVCEWENSNNGTCVEPPTGLVSWWPGDGNAEDIVGNNNGTLTGGFAQGKVGQAFILNGISDFVDAGNASSLHVSANNFTVDTWVYFNALSHPPGGNTGGAPQGDMSIIDKMASSNVNTDGWRLSKQADNRFWFCFGGGSRRNQCWNPEFTVFSTTKAATGTWFHVAVVKNADKFSLYVNGRLEDSRSPVPNFLDTNSANLRLGSYVLQGAHLNGMIDEAEVYNRALSSEEIKAIYDAGRAGKCKDMDSDNDGILDSADNCKEVANPDQLNNDGDAQGDACDTDDDNDTVLDSADNCPLAVNADQADNDGDSLGDICDDDDDNDTVLDSSDNCKLTANQDQADADADGQGDACDGDQDGDGVANAADNCPAAANADQADNDGDAQGDACDADDDNDTVLDTADNCPADANADQKDLDGDNIGDVCDLDMDGDGRENAQDNCPANANADQEDTDFDGAGDACDADDDNDGVLDAADNCSLMHNPGQENADGDAQGDVCDGDLDGDGQANETDNCPNVANASQADFDGDSKGDACDDDVDGDGVANSDDACGFTELNAAVNPAEGCSIAQLCPCEGPRGVTGLWKNHGQHVSCVAKSAESFVGLNLITEAEKDAAVSAAAQSACGAKK